MIAGVETFDIKDIADTVKHPCVYVFFDTCALLDILNLDTHQDGLNLDIFAKYEELSKLIDEKRIIPLASVMNYVELESNYNKNCNNFQHSFSQIKKVVQPILDLAENRGLITCHIDYDSLSALEYTKELYESIRKNLLFIKERVSYDRFAMTRVKQKLPPAHKKHEYKDAYIWKTCLDVKSKSKKGDHIFFFTTNIADFNIKDKEARVQLERDCGKKVTIVTSIHELLPKVKKELGIPMK